MSRLIIFLAGGFFLVYGLAFSFAPEYLAAVVTGAKPTGTSALIDFRATYGGMTAAIGLALFYLNSIHQQRACLIIIIMILLGMAATRALGMAVHGPGDTLMLVYLGLEILGSALALIALTKTRSR